MSNSLVKSGRKIAKQQILIAVILSITLILIIFSIWGTLYAQSAFYGAVIAIIPNSVFAFKAFKYAGAQAAKKVIESFFAGEKLKLVLTALLFALAFKFLNVVPVPFLATFCVVVFFPLLTPFYFKL